PALAKRGDGARLHDLKEIKTRRRAYVPTLFGPERLDACLHGGNAGCGFGEIAVAAGRLNRRGAGRWRGQHGKHERGRHDHADESEKCEQKSPEHAGSPPVLPSVGRAGGEKVQSQHATEPEPGWCIVIRSREGALTGARPCLRYCRSCSLPHSWFWWRIPCRNSMPRRPAAPPPRHQFRWGGRPTTANATKKRPASSSAGSGIGIRRRSARTACVCPRWATRPAMLSC